MARYMRITFFYCIFASTFDTFFPPANEAVKFLLVSGIFDHMVRFSKRLLTTLGKLNEKSMRIAAAQILCFTLLNRIEVGSWKMELF